ncbi:hypothetical protein E8E14_008904 [Neopestalotiopsis sp. 37M]|nr:hypothetical protein E8E14_008904 [Neopestalotiopsis sp. 37M]
MAPGDQSRTDIEFVDCTSPTPGPSNWVSKKRSSTEAFISTSSGSSLIDVEPAVATAPPSRANGINTNLPPIDKVEEAFKDLVRRALQSVMA